MTRLQRKQRRLFALATVIVCIVLVAAIGVLVYVAERWEEPQQITHHVYNPPPRHIAEIKAEIAMRTDHLTKHYYRQDIPLDRYLQEAMWNACQEWGVPYELALAVCWRETNYTNLVTEVDGRTYYGMMAVQRESAGYYMDLCGVEHLNSEEDRIRVGVCILGEHIREYGNIRDALCRYSNDYEGWYAESVLIYMDGLLE